MDQTALSGDSSTFGVLHHFLMVVGGAGWPAVVALILVAGGLLIAAIYAAPRLANAWAIARSGATERERALEKRVIQLEEQINAMQDKLEEQARVFQGLIPFLKGADQTDIDALVTVFRPPVRTA
jgi:hypothetical protein